MFNELFTIHIVPETKGSHTFIIHVDNDYLSIIKLIVSVRTTADILIIVIFIEPAVNNAVVLCSTF